MTFHCRRSQLIETCLKCSIRLSLWSSVQDVVSGRAGGVISLIAAECVCVWGNEEQECDDERLKLQHAGVNEILIHRVTANCELKVIVLYFTFMDGL